MSALNQWSVANPLSATEEDGRVDLIPYFDALIRHRDELLAHPNAAEQIAQEAGLNLQYFTHLANMLVSDDDASLLLNPIRERWRTATPLDAESLVADIRAWQQQLWKFNTVGHFGSVRNWQAPISPVVSVRDLRVPLQSEGSDIVVRLEPHALVETSMPVNVEWLNPRIERPGRATVALRDVGSIFDSLSQIREQGLGRTREYLAAAFEAKVDPESFPIEEVAARRGNSTRVCFGPGSTIWVSPAAARRSKTTCISRCRDPTNL